MTNPNQDYDLGTEQLPEAELDKPAGSDSGEMSDGSNAPLQEAESIPVSKETADRRAQADVMEPAPAPENEQPAALSESEEEESLHGSVAK